MCQGRGGQGVGGVGVRGGGVNDSKGRFTYINMTAQLTRRVNKKLQSGARTLAACDFVFHMVEDRDQVSFLFLTSERHLRNVGKCCCIHSIFKMINKE